MKQFKKTPRCRVLASACGKVEEYAFDEPEGNWPFHEVVEGLMWLSNQSKPDLTNATRAVARYCHSPTVS